MHPFPHPSCFGMLGRGHRMFQNNKEVAHREWLQMQELSIYRIEILNSWRGGKNISMNSRVTLKNNDSSLW